MFFYSTRLAAQGQQVVRDLGRLGAAIGTGSRELLEAAVDEVARPAIRAEFTTSGRADPWAELEPATVERRRRGGVVGDRPLIASGGGMAEALDRERWTITSSEARYTAPPGPIRHHQAGDRDGHVPARPYVRLTPADGEALDAVGLQWVDGIAARFGF